MATYTKVRAYDAFLMLDIETPWISDLPVERVLKALLKTMQLHAHRSPYVVAPVLNILFSVSSIDTPQWLEVLSPTFCTRFYALAVACPNNAIREHAWNCFRAFFAKCCQGAFSPMNEIEENGSDIESRMDIDPTPSEVRDIVSYLWDVMIDCLIMAKSDIPHAAKAFETAAEILRYLIRLTGLRLIKGFITELCHLLAPRRELPFCQGSVNLPVRSCLHTRYRRTYSPSRWTISPLDGPGYCMSRLI